MRALVVLLVALSVSSCTEPADAITHPAEALTYIAQFQTIANGITAMDVDAVLVGVRTMITSGRHIVTIDSETEPYHPGMGWSGLDIAGNASCSPAGCVFANYSSTISLEMTYRVDGTISRDGDRRAARQGSLDQVGLLRQPRDADGPAQ